MAGRGTHALAGRSRTRRKTTQSAVCLTRHLSGSEANRAALAHPEHLACSIYNPAVQPARSSAAHCIHTSSAAIAVALFPSYLSSRRFHSTCPATIPTTSSLNPRPRARPVPWWSHAVSTSDLKTEVLGVCLSACVISACVVFIRFEFPFR